MHTSAVAPDRPCIYLVKEKQRGNEFLSLPATSAHPISHSLMIKFSRVLAAWKRHNEWPEFCSGNGRTKAQYTYWWTVQHRLVFLRAMPEQAAVRAEHTQRTCWKYSRCCFWSFLLASGGCVLTDWCLPSTQCTINCQESTSPLY